MTRKMTNAIALLLMFAMAISLNAQPTATAHSPAWQIPTYSFCNVSPNPIGVGQQTNVNFWITIVPPTANAQFGDRWGNMTVQVTKPDGTIQTLGPFTSDATGGSYTTYTPSAVGNYTFQMSFQGQTLMGANLSPGDNPLSYPNIGDYYLPSQSNIFSLTVQQEPITYPPTTPLPTKYWTRPIYAENNNWYSIAGNWLGIGQSSFATTGWYDANGNYNPYTTSPNTAHIMWTKPLAFGGTMGGDYGGGQTGNFYSTSQYEPKFAPIIMHGILYYTMFPNTIKSPAGWAAIDLHTGQTLWTKDTTDLLRCGQILDYFTPNQYGGLAYLWSIPGGSTMNGMYASGGSMKMWDAMTGNYILTIENITAPSIALTNDDHGGLIGYYVGFDNTLNLWNATRCINLGSDPTSWSNYEVIADTWVWRPVQDSVIDFSLGLEWSAPLADNIAGQPLIDYENSLWGLAIYGVWDDVVLFYESDTWSGFQPGWQIEAAYSAVDGSELWLVNRTLTPYSQIYGNTGMSDYGNWMGDGVYLEYDCSKLSATCYSLTTGMKLWGPTTVPNASPFSSLGADCQIANGTAYLWLYGGDVYAYDLLSGKLKWQYHTPSAGYESPYGRNSLWTFSVGTIADGKFFISEGHMYSPPLYHDAKQLALNITDGSVVWSIDAFDVTSAPAVSDGIMVTLNAYDNQIYAYGKGPTAMTVVAPAVGVTTATPITITGTVLDISAGSQQQALKMNYPYGVPCVSDESMTLFMEALYMQQQMPTNIIGVPIAISVLDSNGNHRQIGTTTSTSGGSFGFTWTPDIPGDYTLYASFAGSASYYSSSAETSFHASAAPVATPEPTQAPVSLADQYMLPGIGIVVAAIAAVGIAIIALLLRKK